MNRRDYGPDLVTVATGPRDWKLIVCGGGRLSQYKDGPGEAELQNNDRLMAADRILCEWIQRGMKARHGRGGHLVELDRVIKDFHHFLGWRLFDHELAEAWQDKAEPDTRSSQRIR